MTLKKIRGSGGKINSAGLLFWSSAALAAGLAALQFVRCPETLVQSLVPYSDRGEMMVHAVRGPGVGYSMPLMSLLAAAQQHLGFDPALPAQLAGLLICLASYAIGARGGGPARGILFALAPLLVNLHLKTQQLEQVIYSLALLSFLNLELLRQSGRGLLVSAAAGAAAGVTLLIRSPLFLFPPLAALYRFLSAKAGSRKLLLGSLLFLICAYAPLAPWARLNHSLSGRFNLLEEERPAANVITGAMGMVYTIEGDARALAGLSRTESVYPWAIKTVLASPVKYAFAVLKRVWQVFLMFPLLFLLAGCGLFLSRSAETKFLAFFCAYFISIHCLLSVEERYFQPLWCALALIPAAGAWELLKKTGLAAERPSRDHLTAPLFLLTAGLAVYALGFVWRYPSASKPGLIALLPELKKRPAEPWLLMKKGETLLSYDLTGEGLDAFSQACAESGGTRPCYITAVLRANEPPAPPKEAAGDWDLLLVKMLRELELGRDAAAGETFKAAHALWLERSNMIKGGSPDPSGPGLQRIIETNKSFWDGNIYSALSYFPPEARSRIIKRLAGITGLTPALQSLAAASARSAAGEEDTQGYDAALAYARELVKTPYFSKPEERALPPRLDALFSALAAAGKNGAEAELLLRAGPSAGNLVGLYLNSADGDRLARTALRISRRSPENCLYPLIRYLALKGNRAEEAKAASALARAFDNSPLFMLAAAETLAASGEGREKAAALAACAGKSPLLTGPGREKLALLYQDLGLYKEAMAETRALLDRDPRSPALKNNMGVLLLFLGREKEAEAAFRQALAEDRTAYSPALSLAAIYSRRGNTAESVILYRKALESPGLPPAEKARIREELKKSGRAP